MDDTATGVVCVVMLYLNKSSGARMVHAWALAIFNQNSANLKTRILKKISTEC
jgi:hypothetical protein